MWYHESKGSRNFENWQLIENGIKIINIVLFERTSESTADLIISFDKYKLRKNSKKMDPMANEYYKRLIILIFSNKIVMR